MSTAFAATIGMMYLQVSKKVDVSATLSKIDCKAQESILAASQ